MKGPRVKHRLKEFQFRFQVAPSRHLLAEKSCSWPVYADDMLPVTSEAGICTPLASNSTTSRNIMCSGDAVVGRRRTEQLLASTEGSGIHTESSKKRDGVGVAAVQNLLAATATRQPLQLAGKRYA